MMFKKWKKDYITKGGWKKPKNLLIKALCKYDIGNSKVIWGIYNILKAKGLLPKKSLRGDHVFISGAGSGIGRLMAVEFAKQGCNLSLSDVNLDGLNETSKFQTLDILEALVLTQTGSDRNVCLIKCDVSDVNQIKDAGRTARDSFGPVTILVNNAGIASGKGILEKSEQMIRKTFEVNTISHLFTIREFLPDMIKLNKGHVVTIASIAGTVAIPGMSDYSASKFGAFAIDECLRLEMKKAGYNIKTTCICPYYINTGMFEGVPSSWYSPILD